MLEKIISNLTEEEAQFIEQQMQAKEAALGEILVAQGTTGQDLYFLIAGTCDVYRKMRLGGHVCALHIVTLEGPTLLGEANLLLNQERNATVVARDENVKYLILPHTGYLKIEKERPNVALKLLGHAGKVVASRFIQQNDSFQDRVINQEQDPQKGLAMLKKFSAGVKFCKPDTARKLFGIKNAYHPDEL